MRSIARPAPDMKEDDPRYISADGPVNLRHARREDIAPAAASEEALARVERVHARHLLGASLQAQMRAVVPHARQPTHPAQIGSAVAAATGAVLLLLGGIQSQPLLTLPGAGLLAMGLAGLAALAWQSRRRAASKALSALPTPRLFDDEALARFDTALDKAALELGEPVCQQLLALKASLVRIGTGAAGVGTDEHFTRDDRMYVQECLRRYIPDSLEAYLRVPGAQRQSAALGHGESPQALLMRQLALLQAELDRREEALGRSAAEGLRRQQRFLEAKRRG